MIRYLCQLFFLGLLFWSIVACHSENAPEIEAVHDKMILQVKTEGVQLRETPETSGNVIATLPAGALLYDLGEVSSLMTTMYIEGRIRNEPWLRVRTKDGREGWIYGGMIQFQGHSSEENSRRINDKRLLALLGTPWMDSLTNYRISFEAVQSVEDFQFIYRQAMRFRDDLIEQLETVEFREQLPDLFWVEEIFPGFVVQLKAEGTGYYFFADYRQWLDLATQSAERTDNEFIDLQIATFPVDSIEYIFPVWMIQTSDNEGHSLLGRGYHEKLITRIDRLLMNNGPFESEINQLKEALIDDIVLPEQTYWETKDKILNELKDILSGNFPCLDRNDRVALEARMEQFQTPDNFGIRINEQAGID